MSAAHVALLLLVYSGCCASETSMPSSTSPPVLSAFTPLEGGYSQAIAPGSRLVTIGGFGATWWERGAPVTVELPGVRGDGARLSADGRVLRVGLGSLDLASRTFAPAPSLAHWDEPGPAGDTPVTAVAWFEDGVHVAMILESREGATRTTEVVVATAADGRARGRRAVPGAAALAAAGDRVLVAGASVVLLDLDAGVIAEPADMPRSVFRVREGAGVFAAVGAVADRPVALLRPADGAVLARWDLRAADVVPIPGGIIGVDADGRVHVGCVEGDAVRTVATAESGVGAPVVQLVGDQLVVAGAGADPVRVARFGGACR